MQNKISSNLIVPCSCTVLTAVAPGTLFWHTLNKAYTRPFCFAVNSDTPKQDL